MGWYIRGPQPESFRRRIGAQRNANPYVLASLLHRQKDGNDLKSLYEIVVPFTHARR